MRGRFGWSGLSNIALQYVPILYSLKALTIEVKPSSPSPTTTAKWSRHAMHVATSFPGFLLFTPQEAREGRPWLGLVTCLPEKNLTQGGVLRLPVFVKIYCPLQKEASTLLRAAHAKLVQLAMFFSSLHFASYNCNIKSVVLRRYTLGRM